MTNKTEVIKAFEAVKAFCDSHDNCPDCILEHICAKMFECERMPYLCKKCIDMLNKTGIKDDY